MKKIIIFISFVSLTLLSAQGFGIKGGVNLGKFTGDDISDISDELDEKYHIGYSGGVFLSVPFGENFALRPEILYTANGAQFEGSEEGYEAKLSMNLNWINVPVLAVLNFGSMKIFVGPYFDFFLNGKMKIEFSYDGESFDEEEDIDREEINSFLYGGIVGVAIGLGKTADLEIRYSQGMNTIDKEPDDWDDSYGEYEEDDIKPNMIQAMITFNLSK